VPTNRDARLFYRCALQRFEEAQILRKSEKTTGAMYLAGYAVECMLKALLLSATPESRTSETIKSFRGGHGHSFDWLRDQYLGKGGARFPPVVNECFALLNEWSVEWRYDPGVQSAADSDDFLDAVNAVLAWAKARF